MKTRKTSLLLATTSAAALSLGGFALTTGTTAVTVGVTAIGVAAFSGLSATEAYAKCVGDNAGGGIGVGDPGWGGDAAANTITCDNAVQNGPAANFDSRVFGGDGDDTITTVDALNFRVHGNDGDDSISVTGGFIQFSIRGDDLGGNDPNGNDTINFAGNVLDITGDSDNFAAQGGDDVITMTDGTVRNSIFGESGNDTISVTGGTVGNDVEGNAGDDDITIATRVDDDVYGDRRTGGVGDGADFIELNTGADVSSVFGDSGFGGPGGDDGADTIVMNDGLVRGGVFGEGGDDEITMNDGQVNGDIAGNDGDDTISVTGGTVGDGGLDDDVRGGQGDDSISVANATVTGDVQGDSGNDMIDVQSSDIGDEVLGGTGNDTISVTGGTVADDVEGNGGDDMITVAGFVSNNVLGDVTGGDDGDDLITLNAGADVFAVFGDSNSGFTDDDGDDTIVMNDGLVFGGIFGEGGNDSIDVLGGAVFANVEGNGGDDSITVGGDAFVSGDVIGDKTGDPDGEDLIQITGGTVTGNVFGDSGSLFDGDDQNDMINITGGQVGGSVWGEGGDDVITMNDGVVLGSIFGDGVDLESGADTITVNGGTVGGGGKFSGLIVGGDDEDMITLNDGSVVAIVGDRALAGVDGAGSDDVIALNGGNVSFQVWGQGGDDVISLDGAIVDDNIDAGFGNDSIGLLDGVAGTNVLGAEGEDFGVVSGVFDFANLGGGTGNFAGDNNTETDLDFDELDFIGWTGDANADQLPEWNDVDIIFGSAVTFTGGVLETNGPSDIEVFIDDTSALLLNDEGGGDDTTIVGNLTNEGLIDLSSADGEADNILTVTGNYTASSDLVIDTFLNDGVIDITDQMLIDGNATGQTDLTVNPVPGSPGGLTGDGPTDGILVVGVGGVSDDDAFSLTNADLVAGIFKYELVNPEGQPFGRDDWYLQSDWLDQIYVYETLPGAMQAIGLALTGQLVERVGVRSAVQSPLLDANGVPVEGGAPVDTAVWARAVGSSLDSEGDLESTTGGNFNQTIGFVQGGAEVVVSRSDAGRFLIGALGHWGTSTVDVNDADNVERGTADFDYYGGGLTATWYGTSGLYLDVVGQYTAYDIDVSTTSRFSSVTTDGWGVSVSGEAGYRIPISETAAIVPQAQVIWQTFEFDDFTDPDGVRVSYQDDDSLVGRLGVAFENSAAIGSSLVTGYLEANVLHEFLGDNTINTFTPVGGTIPISQDLGGTSVEVGFGGTVAVNRGVSLYAEVDYNIPFDNGLQGFQALGGIRVNLNPAPPPPMPVPEIIPVPETAFIVFFDWDRADLTPEANLVLDDVVVVANESGYASIRLDGYTDLSGSAAYNLGLSERRANSVADGLIARGIAPDEIVIRAFGEENPLVPTPDGVREPQNRRVEIFLS